MIRVSLYYLTPLWLVLLLLLPEVYARRPGAPGGLERSLLARFHLTVLGVLVAGALAGILGYLKFRWLIPAFFLVPVYAFSRLPPDPPDAGRLRRYSLVLLAAGSWDPAAISAGYRAVLALQDEMDQGRQRRLVHLGFPADEAADISALHTRNFM